MASAVRGVRLGVQSLESREVPAHWGGWSNWGRNWWSPPPANCAPPPPSCGCPPPVANSQVSGLVYADLNKDGVAQDNETRLQGVTVTLTGKDTAGNNVSQTTTTDQGGIYYFRTLPAGTYQIQVTTPSGYTPGGATVGAFGGNPSPNLTTNIVIPAGQSSGAYNFGELQSTPMPCGCTCHQPPPVKTSGIGGFTYLDKNRNGVFDSGDTALSGVAVALTGTDLANNPVSLSTSTGTDATYNFGTLAAGTYTVSATPPDGLLTGFSSVGAFSGTPGQNTVTNIPVPAGQSSNGYDFSFQEPPPS
jgi:hypothetical protein